MKGHALFSVDVNFNSISPRLLSKSGCRARQCNWKTPEWHRELSVPVDCMKKRNNYKYRKIALRLTDQSPGADVRNCRGILEA